MRPQATTGSSTGVSTEIACPSTLCPKHQAWFRGSFRLSFLGRNPRGVASDKHTCHSRLGTFRPPGDANSTTCRASNRITATTSFMAPDKLDEDRAASSAFLFGYDAQRRAEAERELRKLTDNGSEFGVKNGMDASTPKDVKSERVANEQEQRLGAENSLAQQSQEASSPSASQIDPEGLDGAAQVDSKEALRRRKISEANKGKRPWNVGRKHSEETKRRIRERTKQAMQRPDVVHRLKKNFVPKPHTPETKAKIASSLREYRILKKQVIQELVNQETEESLSAAIGELVDPPEVMNPRLAEGLEKIDPSTMDPEKLISTATAKKLTEHFSVERIHRILRAARKLRAKASEAESSGSGEEEAHVEAEPAQSSAGEGEGSMPASSSDQEDAPGSEASKQEATRRLKAAEHRAKIADSIKKKWEDPGYRARVIAGNARQSSSIEKPPRRRSRSTTPKATTAPKSATSRARPKAERKTKPKAKTIVADVKLPKSERRRPPEERLSQETMNKKLQVAARLAREMEAALTHFSEQELKEDNPEVQQSVWEAQELLRRAKAQVKKLSEGRQVAVSKQDARLEDGRELSGLGSDEVDNAMLILNME